MSKFHSCPPVIILMDVLFIFLFSSLLERPPHMTIVLPVKLFPNAEIIFIAKDDNRFWYKQSDKSWYPINQIQAEVPFYFDVDCKTQCLGVTPPTAQGNHIQGQMKVALMNSLYRQIAELTGLACNTGEHQCGNITFTITQEGIVDKKKLIKDNPVFMNINGIEYFINDKH